MYYHNYMHYRSNRCCKTIGIFALYCLFCIIPFYTLTAQEFSGVISSEFRYFPEKPLYSRQPESSAFSISAQPRLLIRDFMHSGTIVFQPFIRWDNQDSRRSHFDIRELYAHFRAGAWDIGFGVQNIFWGVTESQHLIDIVNQVDFVENMDRESKLGQPAVYLSTQGSRGMLEILCMTGFRERTFPGVNGRMRGAYPVRVQDAEFESRAGSGRIDYAVRYSNTLLSTDFGLYHFYGTSREPEFKVTFGNSGDLVVIPYYPVIHQTGIDIQKWYGSVLFKLESYHRKSVEDIVIAFTGGVEFPVNNLVYSERDITLFAEYLYDGRGDEPPVLFDDDFFLGLKIDMNDSRDTSVQSGLFLDRNTKSILSSLKFKRRIFNQVIFNIEYLGFIGIDDRDLFYDIRNDSYLQINFSHFF